eukprot:6052134-Pyramimonas_sp.AAC.1
MVCARANYISKPLSHGPCTSPQLPRHRTLSAWSAARWPEATAPSTEAGRCRYVCSPANSTRSATAAAAAS